MQRRPRCTNARCKPGAVSRWHSARDQPRYNVYDRLGDGYLAKGDATKRLKLPMHLSLSEAIIVLLALPSVATILFWRLPILRRHRVARWLLAPGVYLGVAALGIIVGISLGWFTDDLGRRPAQYAVKMENWKNDPYVKEVRAIYDEIRAGVKDHRYEIKTRNFDVESSLCSSPYPINSKSLVEDEANRVRMLKIVQVISHRELLPVERYYDTAGKLRFVYVDYGSNNARIYLNAEGKVFWAVEQNGNNFTVGDYTNEDWPIKPSDAADAKEGFRSDESCPEVKK